ncbi:MAG: GNAT family N-acetyltransferase, partial [Anaerolineae bacterium]|nr:GNAT family N-acetyltransferase [Anaerolineae bacterium]
MTLHFRTLTLSDYNAVLALWQSSEGVGLSDADSREAIGRYLARNPGLSFTAWDGDELTGAVLCGHDGRRGYVHHLAVKPAHRRQGLGKALAARCL